MKVSVVDLGVNNIRSVVGALEHLGIAAQVASRPQDLGEICLLPGIGHFGFVSRLMRERGWTDAVKEHAQKGLPVLGICLGMQLLFSSSQEAPGARGLGLLPGEVVDLASLPVGQERLPVTGWRKLESGDPAMAGNMYFNHSYGLPAEAAACLGSYSYGNARIAAVVGREAVVGLQFHPEKSGMAGLHLLQHSLEKISKGSI